MNSPPYSQYWAALVEWSDEACGRGRDIYIAPSASELLIAVSNAVINHYLGLFDARQGFIDLRGIDHQIAKFDGRHYDEHEWDSNNIAQEAKALVERDIESLKSLAVPRSICGDWYDYCCTLKESCFWGDTDYSFVRIEGPIFQVVQELLSVEQEYLNAVEVKTRRQQDWFDKLLEFASLPASAWNDERVFRDFSKHAARIKDWIYDDIENPEDNDAVSSGTGTLSAEHRLLESGPIVRDTWTQKLASLLARHRYTDAYRLLDRVIEHDLPLFHGDPEGLEARRMAWLCRIDLLREQGRLAEALAWTCLECEIIPQNVTAQAMKEQLKRKLNLGYSDEHGSPAKADRVFDGWDGVAGMRELKAILERDFVLPLQEPELYERYQVDMPNGVLFYGPPGCGKTFIARALAKKLDYSFFDITPSDLGSIYVHGTQGKIRELFDKAAEAAPSLIFFDELDALIPNRSETGVSHHYSTEVNEFLVQLNECATRQIAVVGATNFLKKVDPAARRPGRLDKNVFIGPPDIEARQEALRLFMKDRPQSKIKWFGIAQYSEGHSFAELKFVVDEAARKALSDRRPISSDDLLAVIDRHPPQPKMSAEDYLS
jgi:tetratricopeptide (TPR) repeat protein